MAVRDTAISSAVEDYAKAIYALESRGGETVTMTAIAERLGVTAASASGMVRKLCELELVSHEPYKGVRLTERGAEVALEVIDKQPFDGPLFVRFGNDVHVLGGALGRAMHVEMLA